MPERRTLYDGEEAVYPRTISSEVYVSDGVTFEDQIAESLGLVEEAEQALIDGLGYKTYTVRIDLNNSDPETACTYMDDAVSMTSGYNGWKDTKIIKNIKPCVLNNGAVQYYLQKDNYTLKEDGTASVLDGTDGDVMVEIPKIGYRLWNDENYQYVSVTEDPNKDGYCYYAHSLETIGDCDKIYIGAYLGYVNSNNLYSRSGVSLIFPTDVFSLTDSRTYSANRGTGYSIISFFPWTLLQCLYVVIYKNLDSQTALGKGYTNDEYKTGVTNKNSFCYGDPNDDTKYIKFLGIENMWNNLGQQIDGIYCDNNYNIKTDYRNSVFTGTDGNNFQFSTATGALSNYTGYINKIMGTNTTGFIKDYNNNTGGTNSTYFADYGGVSSSSFVCGAGAIWSGQSSAGIFRLNVSCSASSSSARARLMYKQLAN